ncbi:MAG TPA: hypothetical protein VH082_00530 [Rudaea sp.]|jgi:hypothetical protein|nr:hypothetical protein [Rudaea sp.]
MTLRPLILALTLASPLVCASVPADFVVAPNKLSFSPAEPFHAGDRLQVESPYLYRDDLVALGRCVDAGCAQMDIVRVWTAHRHGRMRDYVNIQQDGNYVFFGTTVPRDLPLIERQGCFRSAPLKKVCSGSKPIAIIDMKKSPTVFRVRFSTDSWFWVRKTRSVEG